MIYISQFRKNIWPLYVNPFPDELFSSWICRLAYNHRVSPEILINESLNKKSTIKININNIDIEPEPNIIDIITKNTPIKIEELNKLFLTDYQSSIVGNNIPEEILFSLLFLNINDPKKSKRRIVFCPNCLTKETPYFRKKWALSTSIICCECNSYLIDYCPNCYNPFSYWNSNYFQIHSSITRCKCGYDISKNSFSIIPSKLEIEYQNYIDFTISNGFNDHTQYSFTYLNVLMFTAFMIKNIIKTSKYKKKLLKVYPDIVVDIKVPINKWTIADRQHLLPIAFYLLQDFPNRIRYVFPKKYNLKREFSQLPYWFEKELIFR